MSHIRRRDFLALGGAALAGPLLAGPAFPDTPTGVPLHGLSAFGDLKYQPGFRHFDYVDPDAPTGGAFNFQPPSWTFNQSTLTFNTLDTFAAKGDAPPRMEMCFDTLMASALDEPDAVYGLLAETVTIGADRNHFDFRLRATARFHDGSPLTADDVAFTMKLFKEKGHPSLVLTLRHLDDAVALDPATVRLVFSGAQSSRTILDVAQFHILSKADHEANAAAGSDLKAPLGSGAYRVGLMAPGRTIEYERVPDYWGRHLGVNVGQNNFDRIRIEFYRERQAAFEAFKKGDIHYRQEFTARVWATGYDFPAITAGKVVKREFPDEKRPSMQAIAVNQRRARFRDPRVRLAIGLCFDFEWTQRNLFYGSYERSQSCFETSDFKAAGRPGPAELALMEPLRDGLPPEAFGDAVTQAVTDGSGRDRDIRREASRLLSEAGWSRSDAFLADGTGETLAAEILVQDDAFVTVFSPWTGNMRAIGIDASIRLVDPAQYQARQAEFDFDITSLALSFTATPTRDELEGIFHSRSASLPGSSNLPGTSDPAVDALIDAVGKAADRAALTVAMRALDRVLRARRDWIPSWYSANHRVAYWDMFGFKEPKPDYGFPVETIWWFDEAKAAAIGKG